MTAHRNTNMNTIVNKEERKARTHTYSLPPEIFHDSSLFPPLPFCLINQQPTEFSARDRIMGQRRGGQWGRCRVKGWDIKWVMLLACGCHS